MTPTLDPAALVAAFEADVEEARERLRGAIATYQAGGAFVGDLRARYYIALGELDDAEAALRHARRRAERAASEPAPVTTTAKSRKCRVCNGHGMKSGPTTSRECTMCHGTGKAREGGQ